MRRTLWVGAVSLRDVVHFQGVAARIDWEVRGCDKIIVKNYAVIPGDRTGAIIEPSANSPLIEICFCGAGRKIIRKLDLRIFKASMDEFTSAVPKTPLVLDIVCPEFAPKLGQNDPEIRVPQLHSPFDQKSLVNVMPEVEFDFEPYNRQNYKTIEL